jgi:hypothetical protein
MSNRILYNQNTQLGKMTAQVVNELITSLADLRRVKSILDAAQFGNPADWNKVAVELGLIDQNVGGPSGPITYTAVQQAQDLTTILANVLAQIDVAQLVELKRLDQG